MEYINHALARIGELPIYYVIVGFSGCGVLLLILLISQARQARFNTLSRHRSAESGVADLLNWAAVIDDGVILNKNGSLMAAWVYRGTDKSNATNAERNTTSHMINAAINQLGSGWMFHIDAVRWACPSYSSREYSHFPDVISEAFDEERRQYFEGRGTLFEGVYVLVATYFPPVLAQAKFVEMMIDDPESKTTSDSERGKRIVEQFKKDVDTLEGRLSAALTLRRLKGVKNQNEDGSTYTEDDFLRWLHFCLTGINQPIRLPDNPAYIDCLLGGQEMVGGTLPLLGNKYIKVVAIDNFPFESSPGILNRLSEMPVDYRWSTRFVFLDQHESVAACEKYRRKWRQKIRGLAEQIFRTNSGQVNQDALLMVQDCDDALMEVNSGAVAMGYFTSVVVIMDEDRNKVEAAAGFIQKSLGNIGFPARVEDVNTVDAFLGSLPGHGVENVRRCLMNTRHVADMMPTSSIWTGDQFAPCPFYPPMSPSLMHCVTTGYSPFWFNQHVGDLGHMITFGPTGAGKSTLLCTLVAQSLRYPGMTKFVFDIGNSCYTFCKAVGGQHYAIGATDGVDEKGNKIVEYAFCPLRDLESQSDKAWACTWIETLVELNDVKLTPEKRNEIAARVEGFSRPENRHRTLLAFVNGLNDREMKEALAVYTRGGMMGYLLDADEDGLQFNAQGGLVVFEISELMSLGKNRYILPVLLYLFRRIEKMLRGQPAGIDIDEAWQVLGEPAFRDKLREWFKQLRKNNCALSLFTQSLSDSVNSGILDVIVESTATKIFLPNAMARGEDTAEVYKRFGLNSRQIEIISSAIPKRQYYMTCANGSRLFELALGPLQLALVAVSDKDSLAKVRALESRFGSDWVYEWFRIRGVDETVIEEIRRRRGCGKVAI